MIDIALLASIAISTLVSLFKKGTETISGEASKGLYQWIANKLAAKNKQKDLEALKNNPDNQRLQGKIETSLEDIIMKYPSLIEELSKLIEAAKKEAVSISNKNIVSGSISAGGSIIVGDNNSL